MVAIPRLNNFIFYQKVYRHRFWSC